MNDLIEMRKQPNFRKLIARQGTTDKNDEGPNDGQHPCGVGTSGEKRKDVFHGSRADYATWEA